jgi:hypothetical protein
MTKRFLAAAMAVALLALGATTVAEAKGKAKAHTLTATAELRILKTVNNVVTITGTLAIKGVGSGAAVLVSVPSGDHFNFAGTVYFGNGTLKVTGTNKSTVNPDGSTSYAGTVKIVGGSGAGKTWRGSGTATGAATKDDPTFVNYSLAGKVTY